MNRKLKKELFEHIKCPAILSTISVNFEGKYEIKEMVIVWNDRSFNYKEKEEFQAV